MNQKDLHAKLLENKLVEFSVQYFGRLAKREDMPYTMCDNGRKDFDYDKVVEALARMGKIVKNESTKDIVGLSLDDQGEYTLPAVPTLDEAKIFREIQAGKKLKLEVDTIEDMLVVREEMEDKAFSVARIVRDKMLAIPNRVVLDLMSMTGRQEIVELLFGEINQSLEEISEEAPFQ